MSSNYCVNAIINCRGKTHYFPGFFISMAIRFTDTEKWKDEWFIDLKPHEKLMFNYLCDNCDIAGFLEPSKRKLSFDLGLTPDEVKIAFRGLKKAYTVSIDKRVIFIKNFLKHQKNIPLNKSNPAHRGIFKRFENYKNRFDTNPLKYIPIYSRDLNSDSKGLFDPIGIGSDNLQDNVVKGLEEGLIANFETYFWNPYGKKLGDKKECLKKWSKLKPSVQKKIYAMLPKWRLQFRDLQFQPYPATFLNQERWNDEVAEQKAEDTKELKIAM